MNRFALALLLVPLISPCLAQAPKPLYRDPVYDGAADVSIIYDRGQKHWKMFYTNRRATLKLADRKDVAWVHGTKIGIATSRDGEHWTYQGVAQLPGQCTSETSWAPELYEENGTYHMWLTVVSGIFHSWKDAGAQAKIVHLTSKDLRQWNCSDEITSEGRIIDASVLKLGPQDYRLFYKDEGESSHLKVMQSTDLKHWSNRTTVTMTPSEGPKAFWFKGHYWIIADAWKGLLVLRSEDGKTWTEQADKILAVPGTKPTDVGLGQHPDVVVSGDHAYIYYFVHQFREPEAASDPYWGQRTVIQAAELHEDGGKLTVDRDADVSVSLVPPGPTP